MAARDRDTYIHRRGVTPETASTISSRTRIYSTPADATGGDLFQIGVIATFDPTESRTIEPVRGIGYGDHVAELVPGVTEPMTLAVTRTAQYLSGIAQVFGYKGGVDGLVRSLRQHKWPFDIVQEVIVSRYIAEINNNTAPQVAEQPTSLSGDELRAVITYFEGCWISDYSASYAADAALVQENVTVNVTSIVGDISKEYAETDDLFNVKAVSLIMGKNFDLRSIPDQASGGLTL
jgi:hypothetical protein